MDRRIRYLQTRLPNLKVVDQKPSNCEQVFFGAYVTLLSMQDAEITYRIVGPDEFSPEKNWISMDSPMAKALMKRETGEVINVRLPEGEAEFEILEVSYN